MTSEAARSSIKARLQERLATVVDTATAKVSAARQRWMPVEVAFATHERDRRAVGSVLAGAIAFRLFVYLLPLFLAVVTLLGILRGLDPDSTNEIGERLGLSRYIADSVETAARESHRSLWILVPLSLWAIYWAGVGAAKVLWAIHIVAWGQPVRRLPRSWLAAPVVFGVVLATGLSISGLQAVRQASSGAGVGLLVLQALLLISLWLGASLVLPHDPAARWVDLLPGALLVGLGVWVLHALSVYFLVQKIESASEMYGSLGVAAALLAWLFILGRLLVASAMLNATLWHRRTTTTRVG